MMLRTLALLSLVAASALAGSWEGGLKVRFDLTIFGIGTTAFIDLPQTVASAAEKGWRQNWRNDLPAGYAPLSIFCPQSDLTLCVFYDDTGYIAGLQVALNKETYAGNVFDWSVQGFTTWSPNMDGQVINYWTIQQYFISPETLATDPAIRVATRNPDLMIQDHSILVSGFNGELYRISTNVSDITGPNSDFTKQACIPWMGQHYYYKTTEDMECKSDTMFPWFPLVYSDQLIGVGLVMFGSHTVEAGAVDWFETPARAAVEAIVPRGPQCLYELADSPGIVTMHTYFIRNPQGVTCVF